MTAGELEYEEVFRFIGFTDVGSRGVNNTMAADAFLSSGGLHYFNMSVILWVIFVLLMPILFANLLISILLISIAIYDMCMRLCVCVCACACVCMCVCVFIYDNTITVTNI